MSTHNSNLPAATQNVLNSWKEIATYLDRGVRTVQRWEAELGLPVRRPRGKSRSAVIAMRADIDEWLKACPLSVRDNPQLEVNFSSKLPNPNLANVHDLIQRSRGLRLEIEQNKAEFKQALNSLIESLGQLAGPQTPGEQKRDHDKLAA